MPDQPSSETPALGRPANKGAKVEAPQLALPKGGGAIRGIGEKFAANPVTGTGSTTIPIATSPGRAGFGPTLSLTYNSGAGNGAFGFGWTLALPAVTRKTDKGLPQYGDTRNSDIFLLSGAEDLVPALVETNGAWIGDSSPRSLYGQQYNVQRYRPRVEGLFARIECWRNTADNSDIFWRTISKENITTWFGQTAESRIADPSDPSRIFSWLISLSYDDLGNVISYSYKPEDSAGIDLSQANERNRTADSRSVQRYIKSIAYGNRSPYIPDLSVKIQPELPTDWCFDVIFDYGEHDAETPTPTEVNPWPCRLDPFSTYRSTFEVRTYRLCGRVLMFHTFPSDPDVGTDCLVRSTNLTHASAPPADPSQPFYSYLLAASQSGYVSDGAGGYRSSSLPPIEFTYTQAVIDETVRELDPESKANLPSGIDANYRWVDLDGEGLSGILTEQAGAWFYKANLSPANIQGSGTAALVSPEFAPVRVVERLPSLAALGAGRQQLLGLSGDGFLSLVQFDGPTPGYFERTQNFNWDPFAPFDSMPVVDWKNPNLRFVDLTGDGFADALISEDDVFWWHQSLATEGFGPAQRVDQSFDEERGPRLIFADGTESIFLADMSGDGLTDLLRIRAGEVCYWPNLGYGRFGAKVAMDGVPRIDRQEVFDARRIHLADIDGSGTSDILYFAAGEVHLYFNQSGNSFANRRVLSHFPLIDTASTGAVLDLLGNGTACLVWSSPLTGNANAPLRYIDLMGGVKPHLLVGLVNNLGAETHIGYAPSTRFYVEDKLAGTPWITRLPFPVQVVERIETVDQISRNRFVTRYSYHHGYYDGVEREFRGFAHVDQWDTEDFATLNASDTLSGPSNEDAASNVPPTLTKTWFHTGFFFNASAISTQLQSEFYREGDAATGYAGLNLTQAQTLFLPDTALPATILLAGGTRVAYDLSGEEMREACRALRGSMLRQEVYALDGTPAADRPYTTAEHNYTLEMLQPQEPNPYAVFLTYARETLELSYERKLFWVTGGDLTNQTTPPAGATLAADPRATHSMILAADGFGNPLLSASIAYGRRFLDPALGPPEQSAQQTLQATATINSYTNAIFAADTNRTPLPAQSSVFELYQCKPAARLPNFTNLFAFAEMQSLVAAASDGAHDILFENLDPTGLNAGEPYRRLLSCTRSLFRPDDLGQAAGSPDALLPLGTIESMALPGNTYKQAFTPGLIAQVFVRGATALLPTPANVLGSVAGDGGGYVDLDGNGNWWIPGTRSYYSPTAGTALEESTFAEAHFYLPMRFVDPFGNTITVAYDDPNNLLVTSTTDAAGNSVSAQNDYRVLSPALTTDANGNQTAAQFDALGLVAGTAVMGKQGQNEGDSFATFAADLTQAQIDAFFNAADPHTPATALLGTATTRFVYNVQQYVESRQAAPNDPTAWQPVFAATLAREVHQSDLAEGQPSPIQVNFSYSDGFGREIQQKLQADPEPVIQDGPIVNPRWVGSGWTIFNNKGKPVRKYEPFFSALPALGHQFEFGAKVGVSSIVCYDPASRAVATIHPNQTYEKVVFDPWHKQLWDLNDTVLIADPSADADVGDFLQRMDPADYSPTWYQQRSAGGLGAQEQDAATKAAAHANTPATLYFDAMGQTILTVDDNAAAGQYLTHSDVDIQGYQRSVTDALGRQIVMYAYDMLGTHISQSSMEAGQRWTLNDVAGKNIRNWDSRGHNRRATFDALRRPTALYVLGTDATNSDPRTLGGEVCCELTAYGEGEPNDQALNLRTRVFQAFDVSGAVVNQGLNPATNQQEAYDFKGNLLRSTKQFVTDPKALTNWPTAPALLPAFVASTRFDALNRPVSLTSPDGSVTTPAYDARNALSAVSVNIRGAVAATAFVTEIDYDAKGQRLLITYGDAGVNTAYAYDQRTFRMIGLTTTRPSFPSNQQTVQDLAYTYDPMGNITHIQDDADIQNAVYFLNRRVDPSSDYTYDAIYRLIEATGREQLGLDGNGTPLGPTPSSYNDVPRAGLTLPGNPNALGIYDEQYQYDAVGNFVNFIHRGSNPANPGWSRAYAYNEASLLDAAQVSNRLSSTTIAGNQPLVEKYAYDPHGNMTAMPQLQQMQWDYADRLLMTQRQAVSATDEDGTAAQGQQTLYAYSGNERARKATFSAAGILIKQRLYIGHTEIYREYDATGVVTLERQTLHVTDDKQRIALVETVTIDASAAANSLPATTQRYQFSNHLGTACLELDENGSVISYEEYYPFGATSYQGGPTVAEVSLKRYRYTGKEKDEETGLYYHGARYYAPWLGRWTACDPTGLKDGPNLYGYCNDNPIRLSDPTGTQGNGSQTEVQVTYETPADPNAGPHDPVQHGIPPLPSEAGSPSTVFANQTQSLGAGLQPNDPLALGGSLSYRRGIPDPLGRSHSTFFPYLDLESNLIFSGTGAHRPYFAPLTAGSFLFQLSARTAPFPGVPHLTVGAVASVGPSGGRGESVASNGSEGLTAQYGLKVAPHWGIGIFGQANRGESSSGPSTYSGTVTPIVQYQKNENFQLALNPTFSAGTGGSFTNQTPYGSYLTGGGFVGVQFLSHGIAELGATYTSASRLPLSPAATAAGTTGSTHETRLVGGIGGTANVSNQGTPTALSFVLNPFVGFPSGGAGRGANVISGGIMLTLTLAFRFPLFHQSTPISP
jgi:RHS repeat-associated protein